MRGRRGVWIGLGLAALAVVVGCTASPDRATAAVVGFLEAVEHTGPLGWAGFVLLYGAITLTGLPASSMQLTAGFLLGPWWGFVASFVLSNGWGFVGFVLARTWLRSHAQSLVQRSPTLRALDGAVADRGLSTVFLLRVSPLSPYNIVNYALGTTGVKPIHYLVGSAAGAILPMALYSGLGASVSDLSAVWRGEIESPGWFQPVALGATLVATVLVTWQVRQKLGETGPRL